MGADTNENRITAFWNDLEEEYPKDYIAEDEHDTMGELEEFNSVPKKPFEKSIHAKKHISL